MNTELNRDDLMESAVKASGLTDFGDLPFLEALDTLIDALNREAKLDDARRTETRGTLTGLLIKRLNLVRDRAANPAIAAEVVKAPLIILGVPRSGSTHLHALMAQCEGIRAPQVWEMTLPSPPPERETYATDPRIAQVQGGLSNVSDEMQKRHPITATRPEQCNLLYDWAFTNQALLAYFEIPTYRDWLLANDCRIAYEAHRRSLQHLQWKHPGQWVLKYPKHLMALATLLETYPDARLVWTHRDPAKVMPSVASFTGLIRSPTPGFDRKRFGREWTAFEELVLLRGLTVRDRLAIPQSQCLDIYYQDLMGDPAGTVEKIHRHFGMSFSETSRTRILAFGRDNPQRKHGTHDYSPEEYGLTEDGLHRRFAFYMTRFGIAPERRN